MDWFKHSATSCMTKELRKLERKYGFAGLGFYWKLVEKIELNDGAFPLEEALSWARREFNTARIKEILNDSNLFWTDDLEMIHFGYKENFSSEIVTDSDEKTSENERCSSEIATDSDEQIRPNAPTREEEKIRKDKKRIDKKNNAIRVKKKPSLNDLVTNANTEEEKVFYERMMETYPNVSSMQTPLSWDEYQRLARHYPPDKIAGTLRAMENRCDLIKRYASAYLTLLNWIKHE